MVGNATIGALRVNLGIDTAQFENGLKKAQGGLAGFGKVAAVGLAAAATAAAAVGAALAQGVGAALNNADDLGKMAQKVGVGVEALSELKYAADLSDVSLDQLGTGLKRLGSNMAAVAGGAKGPAAEAFKALGLSVTDAAGQLKAPDELFKEIAGKFGPMADGAGKTALAMAIFGKSGADLIPMLNSGSTGLAAMAEEARKLGVVIDEKTAKAAETFNDNITRLKTAAGGVTVQLAAGLAPALASISTVFVDVAKNTTLMDGVSRVLAGTLKGLVTGVIILGTAFKVAFQNVAAVAKAFSQVVTGDFAGAWATLRTQSSNVVADYKGAASSIRKVWTDAGADVASAAPKVSDQFAAPIMQGASKAKKAGDDLEAEAARVQGIWDRLGRVIMDPDREKLSIDTTNARSGDLTKLRITVPVELKIDAQASREVTDGIKDVEDALKEAAQVAREAFDTAFYSVANSFDQLFNALSRKNWAGAAQGLIDAAKAINAAFSKGGTTAGRIGAVAGAGDALGQAVGGVGGSALSGAAGGAMIGLQLGGPIGAAAGAVIGGIMGIFSGSKAKKAQKAAEAKARADEAARVAAEAAARVQVIANQKRSLEIQIMELTGDSAGALAAIRADELAAMDESNRGLAERIYALQDEAEAAAKLAILNSQHRALEIELMEAQGDAAGALAASRELELAAMDPSLQALKRMVYAAEDAAAAEDLLSERREELQGKVDAARDALSDAYDREISTLKDTKSEFQSFADDIGAAIAGLTSGGAGDALGEFQRVAALAKLGNRDALGRVGSLAGGAADAVRAGAGSAVDVARGLAGIRLSLQGAQDTALRQVSFADLQIARLDASVEGLLNINDSVLTVNQAIDDLASANLQLMTTFATDALTNAEKIQELRTDLQIGLATIARNTGRTANTLDGAVTPGGLELNTAA